MIQRHERHTITSTEQCTKRDHYGFQYHKKGCWLESWQCLGKEHRFFFQFPTLMPFPQNSGLVAAAKLFKG